MMRSPAARLSLLISLAACGEGSRAPAAGIAAEFRRDVQLPEASQARPWRPPSDGPVPVIEVLGDGSWILDGVPIGGGGAAREEALAGRLREIVSRMPMERVGDLESSPVFPSNPAFLRVDREAPWHALRVVIEICHDWRTRISVVELQVSSSDPAELLALAVPMRRDFGSVCLVGGAWTRSGLLLEAGSAPGLLAGPPSRTPAPVLFLASDYVAGQLANRSSTERFHAATALAYRLKGLGQSSSWPEIGLELPDEAPAWLAVAALDLGARAGVVLWGFPPSCGAPDWTW